MITPNQFEAELLTGGWDDAYLTCLFSALIGVVRLYCIRNQHHG